MKRFLAFAKKPIPAAVATALLLGAVWGVLYGVLVAAVWLVFGVLMPIMG